MKQEIKRRSCSRPSLENICIVTLCSLLLLLEYQYDECFRKVLAIRICILWINTRWPHNWHCEHFRGLIRESHIFFSSAPQLKQEVVKLNTSPVYTSHPCSQDMNLNEICVGFFFFYGRGDWKWKRREQKVSTRNLSCDPHPSLGTGRINGEQMVAPLRSVLLLQKRTSLWIIKHVGSALLHNTHNT